MRPFEDICGFGHIYWKSLDGKVHFLCNEIFLLTLSLWEIFQHYYYVLKLDAKSVLERLVFNNKGKYML